jgi:hypothetical protein
LCSEKKCRDYIQDKNAYVILRELHNWEEDKKVLHVLEKAIQLLISDEPERQHQNLHQVDVPDNLQKKFYEIEKEELEKNFE